MGYYSKFIYVTPEEYAEILANQPKPKWLTQIISGKYDLDNESIGKRIIIDYYNNFDEPDDEDDNFFDNFNE